MKGVVVMGACALSFLAAPRGQPVPAGRAQYERLCARCHGGDGHGGEFAPDIVAGIRRRSDTELAQLIRTGLPQKGMPGATVTDAQLRALLPLLRTFTPAASHDEPAERAQMENGDTLEGRVLNRSTSELQLRSNDGQIHLLRRAGDRYRRVTSETDWPTYHGQLGGNRFSALDEINRGTVGRLSPRWMFSLPGASRLEVTPLVIDGVMYVTSVNECYALDAGSGRRLWHYERPRTKGVAGDAGGGINRGVAVAGDRLFMVTDHAHLIALNRFTGTLVWDQPMADWRLNYGATSAPLAIGELVISGVSGGDEGVRGFVAAFDQSTGKEVWRFWTVARVGEPGSETWRGRDIAHPCASTWLTGTYDPELKTVFWPTGNPCPDYDGSQRLGDNLYSDSILALDAATGRLKWHFQYTPHDVWDWDAQQPPVLIDTTWRGEARKLLLHANRNGFFYVLDRTNGALLLAKPFVKKLTWAREIGADGRPVLNADQEPTASGTTVCPSVDGASNWFSTAFSPATGLYYVQTLEKCSVYVLRPGRWIAGESYYGGSTRNPPGQPGQKVLRAIDIQTGTIAWELPQTGSGGSWGGALATAGGLVFVADDSGAFVAADATNGTVLWHFDANTHWKASPMTYVFDNHQYVAIAAGPTIIAFGLAQ